MLLLAASTSCSIYRMEDCSCLRNVELTFRYHFSPEEEALPVYVGSMFHLLLRNDTLAGMLSLNGTQHGQGLLSTDGSTSGNLYALRSLRCNLPEGDYAIFSWGNFLDGVSAFEDLAAPGTTLRVGQSLGRDIRLRHVKASPTNHGTLDNSERLYFGSCRFSVGRYGEVRRTVDMLNAHLQLSVTVVWSSTPPPFNLRDVRMRLGDAPAGYAHTVTDTLPFMISSAAPPFGPREVAEYVPGWDGSTGTISTNISALESNRIWGRLIGYRLRDEHHPLLSLWDVAGNTQIMKDIDLHRFFETVGWRRTRNHRQQYDILVTVRDGGLVSVEPLDNRGWIDGGEIWAAP
jgi:hypothetical protein